MKSEERHDLAQNELAKIFDRWATKIDPYANQILIGICAVALVAAGIIYWVRTNQVNEAVGWSELIESASTEEYANVADDFAGSPVAHWARTRASWGNLRDGIRLSVTDRSAANERLDDAKAGFEKLLNTSDAPAEAREQSLMGLALTLETQSAGDTQPAIAAYEQLLKEFPESRYAAQAKERVEELKTGQSQQFYAWFSKQTPSPATRPQPNDGSPFGAAGAGGAGSLFDLPLGDLKKDIDDAKAADGDDEAQMKDDKPADDAASDDAAPKATPEGDAPADATEKDKSTESTDEAKKPADEAAADKADESPEEGDAAPADDAEEPAAE